MALFDTAVECFPVHERTIRVDQLFHCPRYIIKADGWHRYRLYRYSGLDWLEHPESEEREVSVAALLAEGCTANGTDSGTYVRYRAIRRSTSSFHILSRILGNLVGLNSGECHPTADTTESNFCVARSRVVSDNVANALLALLDSSGSCLKKIYLVCGFIFVRHSLRIAQTLG